MSDTASKYHVDNESGGAPPKGLYKYTALIEDGIDGFDNVTDAHIEQFFTQGFLVIHNAFTPDAVRDARQAIDDLIRGKNPNFTGVVYEKATQELVDDLLIEERINTVRKLMWYVEYDKRLKELSRDPALMDVIQRIVDDEPDMFQDMALIKPPRIGREKPWHQDMAYFNVPIDTPIVGAWIALDHAFPENGCMMVNPGSHRAGPMVHFRRRDWQICDTDVQVDRTVAIPLQPGGCLLFHGLLHHGTPPSQSDQTRWAVQFHYKPASVIIDSDDKQRLTLFGEDGKNVTC